MKKYFVFQDETSHKFWEIEVLNNKQTISFGRVGSVGTIKEKEFSTNEACLADSSKLIKEKTKKGYIEIENSIKVVESESTTPNEKISSYLKAQLDSYKGKLKSIKEPNSLISDLSKKLEQFDFEAYKIKVEKEIEDNLIEWWTNPSKDINPEEKVFSILFEYDYYFNRDVEANSYGIVSWENFRLHTKSFDMGYDYDFAEGFKAMPGLTLNFFDNLEILDWSKRSDEDEDLYSIEGYEDLLKVYLFSGLIALNEVFAKVDKKGIFKKINSKKGFMFMIGEHDMGEVYPLYTI